METEDQLRDALHRGMRGVDPPVHDLVSAAVREGRAARRSAPAAWLVGAAAAAAVVAGAVAMTAPWDDPPGEPSGTAAGTPTGAGGSCGPAREAVLPGWATAGFSEPRPVIAHVRGDERHIVAVLFGRVLHAPPDDEVNNKILWVARTSSMEPLQIDAVRDGDDRPVHLEVAGGPGPSTIDLPHAGCWHLTLRWGTAPDQRDTMTLQYVAPE